MATLWLGRPIEPFRRFGPVETFRTPLRLELPLLALVLLLTALRLELPLLPFRLPLELLLLPLLPLVLLLTALRLELPLLPFRLPLELFLLRCCRSFCC